MGWEGSWCRSSCEEEDDETAELGGLVPYPDETDATDHLRVSGLRMNGKLTEGLLETFLGLSSGLLPVGKGRGESGLDRVGEGARLFLLFRLLLGRLTKPPETN